MTSKEDVRMFLNDFKVKLNTLGILFRDERGKNTRALLSLDITPNKRMEVLKELDVLDFSEGPINDTLYKGADMWVFGKIVKGTEVYIKITLGTSSKVICISFHEAEFPLNYPFKN